MVETSVTSFLEQLGLTEYEAKTLSSLFKLNEAEAPNISRNAQVPKTRVYDILDRLTKKGLIIEVSGRPKKYRVIEPSNVFEKLIKERKEEIKKFEERAVSFKKNGFQKQFFSESEKIMKVKDKTDFLRILSQEISNTKNSLTVFTEHSENYSLISDAIKKISERQVKVKVISTLLGANHDISKELKSAKIGYKQADHGIEAYVVDKKKVILALSSFAVDKPEYHFIIWPNNLHMANVLQHYFNKLWEEAKHVQ